MNIIRDVESMLDTEQKIYPEQRWNIIAKGTVTLNFNDYTFTVEDFKVFLVFPSGKEVDVTKEIDETAKETHMRDLASNMKWDIIEDIKFGNGGWPTGFDVLRQWKQL